MLAEHVKPQIGPESAIVLALPRGGLPVAFAIAEALRAELDVCCVRKLGVPGDEELAFGAVSGFGNRYVNRDIVSYMKVPSEVVEAVVRRETAEIERQQRFYRQSRPAVSLQGRTVILADDGLATGATMMAAVEGVRMQQPGKVFVAVPVGARSTCKMLEKHVDGLIAAARPHPFASVGVWYEDFSPVSDAEVLRLLEDAAHQAASKGTGKLQHWAEANAR